MKKVETIHVVACTTKIINTLEGRMIELEIANSVIIRAKFKRRIGIIINNLGELAHLDLLKEGDSDIGFTYFVTKFTPQWKIDELIRRVF